MTVLVAAAGAWTWMVTTGNAVQAQQPPLAKEGAPPTPAAGQPPAIPAAGNLNELMRGILFPNSNFIFNVQTHDPGAPQPKPPPNAAPGDGFSWNTWGASMYTPWEMVDYAAIAVAEAAPLLLTPDRLCENGKPVPVERPDWIKFSVGLADAGRAAYKASRSRNQEAVSEATNQLSESCFNCHTVYRDRSGGKAGRCTPRTQ